MKLTLKDRLVLPGTFPKEGSFTQLILARDIQKKLEITQDEIKEFEIKGLETGWLVWNKKGAEEEFEIDFTELENNFIVENLKRLNDGNKLTAELLDVYQSFVTK